MANGTDEQSGNTPGPADDLDPLAPFNPPPSRGPIERMSPQAGSGPPGSLPPLPGDRLAAPADDPGASAGPPLRQESSPAEPPQMVFPQDQGPLPPPPAPTPAPGYEPDISGIPTMPVPPSPAGFPAPGVLLPPPPPPPTYAQGASQGLPGAPPPSSAQLGERYPAWFDVEYREPLSRATTFFRLVMLVPLYILASILGYGVLSFLLTARIAIFWRRKHPVWMYSALAGYTAWQARGLSYALLLTDEFPSLSTEPGSAVTLGFDVPQAGSYGRWRGLLWRWMLCLPHFIALGFLFNVVVPILTFVAWFAILFTGRYPRAFFNFVEGMVRWTFRVNSYLFLLNDRFPPYALSPEASPASSGATTASAIAGVALSGVIAGIITIAAVAGSQPYVEEVDYARLVLGQESSTVAVRDFGDTSDILVEVTLSRAYDPGANLVQILTPGRDERVVVFEWQILNRTVSDAGITAQTATLEVRYEDDAGNARVQIINPAIVTVGNTAPTAYIEPGGSARVRAAFVIPADAEPVSLTFDGGFTSHDIRYEFE